MMAGEVAAEAGARSSGLVPVWSLGAQALGRSDFVRMLYEGQIPEAIAAELTGFVPSPSVTEGSVVQRIEPSSDASERSEVALPIVVETPAELPPSLWRAVGPLVKPLEAAAPLPEWMKSGKQLQHLGSIGKKMPELEPLLPPARLGCVLRQHLRTNRPGNRLDYVRLIAELSRCRALSRLPSVNRPTWPERLQLYWDRSAAIAFANEDQRRVYRWLERWYPRCSLELVFVEGNTRRQWKQGTWCPSALPDRRTTILALSDFGIADGNRPRQEFWSQVRREAERYGAASVALLLCPSRRWPKSVTAGWHALEWERARPLRRNSVSPRVIEQEQELGRQLASLLSPLLRVEPALLRTARKLLRSAGADLGTELDAWLSPHVNRRSREGMALSSNARQDLHPAFMEQPAELRLAVEKLILEHHAGLSPLVLAEEQLAIESKTATANGQEILMAYARRLEALGVGSDSELLYLQRLVERQPASAWKDEFLAAVWALANRNSERTGFTQPLPEGLLLDKVLWTLTRERKPRWVRITQVGNRLEFSPIEQRDVPLPKGSHLADLPLRVGLLQLRWQTRERGETVDPREAGAMAATVDTGSRWILDVERDSQFELPAQGMRTLVIESDLANLEVRSASRPDWATRFYRDRGGLRVKAEIVEFEWEGALSPEPAKPGFIRKFLGTKPEPIGSRASRIGCVTPRREFLWPPWASELNRDRYGLVATLALPANAAMRLRWVPPGRFLMGSPASEMGRTDCEGPQHWVELSSGLWFAETPCTQAQWEAVKGNNPSYFTGDGQRPVEQVSWEDCHEYCGKLNALCPELGARLPTEAEWEYACRAGTATAYNDGSACTKPEGDDPALEKLGWFDKNGGGTTHPVGEKLANAWGIHDLHGNVYEWCSDYWSDNYRAETQQDPLGPTEGRTRVIRGGSWDALALGCRSAYRYRFGPGDRGYRLGFRLATVQSSEPSK